jgi:CheY-like chemotaxis protein
MRIIVIDDEVDVATTLGEVVADLGHRALVAHSAEAALTTLKDDAPDAILLDVRLPGMDGLEFLRRRRPRETTAPVIGISGVATDAEVWECLRLGALDFVRKPFSAELLAALMFYAEARRPGLDIGARTRVEHRRSLRVRMASPVTVVEPRGTTWQTASIDLSVFGMKLRPQPPAWPTEHARLSFAPPDGGSRLDLLAVLVRADSRGWAYRFVNLTAEEFGQLQSLVGDLAASPETTPKTVLAVYQAGTLQIVRSPGTDAAPAGYVLMFDSPRTGLQSRRCATQSELLEALTALRISRPTRITTLLSLTNVGRASLYVSVTEEDLRQAGWMRS